MTDSHNGFFDDLTLGLLYALNSVMGVENIMTVVNDGLSYQEIEDWQRHMDYSLPNDLVNFYALIDGLHITWGYKIGRTESLLNVGLLKIEPLHDLKPVGFFKSSRTSGCGDLKEPDLFTTLDLLSDDEAPKFNTDYKYFYMMVKHAGLPQWQMSKTLLGMSMWAKQLMYTFAMCLRSPPTSVLHCWTVDSNKAKSSYGAAVRDPKALRFAKKTSSQYKGYFCLEPPAAPPNTKRSEIYSISVISEDRRQAETIADVEQITTDTLNTTEAAQLTIPSENSDVTITSTTLPADRRDPQNQN